MSDEGVLKVSGGSNPQSVGSAVAHAVYAGQRPIMRAIGASAVNQAVKAGIIAAGFCANRGMTVTYQLGFDEIEGDTGTKISCVTLRAVHPD